MFANLCQNNSQHFLNEVHCDDNWRFFPCFHLSLADFNLNRWTTNWAFFIASWVSSLLMPRCQTALTVPPTWGNISTRTPWSRASTSSSLTSSINSQKRVGLSPGTRKQKHTMLVSTEAKSTWYNGGSHSVRAVRKGRDFILDTSKGIFYADVF